MRLPSFENPRRHDPVAALFARHNAMSEPSKDSYVEEVRGDFMLPYLRSGDMVLVDPCNDSLSDGLVVFEFAPGVPKICRVQLMPAGVRIFGDNPNYEEQIVSADRARLALMGRVKAVLKRV